MKNSAPNSESNDQSSVTSNDSETRPQWRKPSYAILDVERGTVTTSGPHSDGNGSTS